MKSFQSGQDLYSPPQSHVKLKLSIQLLFEQPYEFCLNLGIDDAQPFDAKDEGTDTNITPPKPEIPKILPVPYADVRYAFEGKLKIGQCHGLNSFSTSYQKQ